MCYGHKSLLIIPADPLYLILVSGCVLELYGFFVVIVVFLSTILRESMVDGGRLCVCARAHGRSAGRVGGG